MLRPLVDADLEWVMPLAHRHRRELGYLIRPELRTATTLVVEPHGFIRYHRRRDGWHTVYQLCSECPGVGRALLEAVPLPRRLRCPAELDANGFYAHLGGTLARTEPGRKRPLCVWEWA